MQILPIQRRIDVLCHDSPQSSSLLIIDRDGSTDFGTEILGSDAFVRFSFAGDGSIDGDEDGFYA